MTDLRFEVDLGAGVAGVPTAVASALARLRRAPLEEHITIYVKKIHC